MKPFLGLAACSVLALLSPAVVPAGLAEESALTTYYCTFLSDTDHHNSKGARLTTAGQIVRQDRANFHRFNIRDEWDEADDLFMLPANRAKLEKRVGDSGLTAVQQAYIVENETYVCVLAEEMPEGYLRIEIIFPE